MSLDIVEQMLADKCAGLSPLARARTLEKIGLEMAKRAAASGDRSNELFWLTRAQEARNEADRLFRLLP